MSEKLQKIFLIIRFFCLLFAIEYYIIQKIIIMIYTFYIKFCWLSHTLREIWIIFVWRWNEISYLNFAIKLPKKIFLRFFQSFSHLKPIKAKTSKLIRIYFAHYWIFCSNYSTQMSFNFQLLSVFLLFFQFINFIVSFIWYFYVFFLLSFVGFICISALNERIHL